MTTFVVDAAAVVDMICALPPARPVREELQRATSVAAPAHIDAEVMSALGRRTRNGDLHDPQKRVNALADFAAARWPLQSLLAPAWALTDRIAVRDALYVALAASLGATLVTTDARLRRSASGLVVVASLQGT